MRFFPSLTDSSYLKIDDDYKSIEKLLGSFPEYKKLYSVPIDLIKELSIPGINYGCFGKDAHKWTERVYMPYSFEVLPKLIIKTLEKYLMRG
jgi:arginine utilization protein RocB